MHLFHIPQCTIQNRNVHISVLNGVLCDINKSHNTPVPYPTMDHSEQKYAHFCSEWCIVGYGAGALWVHALLHMITNQQYLITHGYEVL